MRIIYLLSALFLMMSGCKQSSGDEPEPEEAACLIDRATYSDGSYTVFKFDANGRLAAATLTAYDENGKIVEVPITYEYNAAGNLIKTNSPGGWVDEYTYDAGGGLVKVAFKGPGGNVEEQFTVTTDGQKRIVKIVTINDIVGNYSYDGDGNVTKIVVTWQEEGIVLDRTTYEYNGSNTAKPGLSAVKGHPFSPAYFTDEIIYYGPLNLTGRQKLPVKGKLETQWNEDYSGFGNMRTYADYTSTFKSNSNNFITEESAFDIISGETHANKYSYVNCN